MFLLALRNFPIRRPRMLVLLGFATTRGSIWNDQKETRGEACNGIEAREAAVATTQIIGNSISSRLKFHFVTVRGSYDSLRARFILL